MYFKDLKKFISYLKKEYDKYDNYKENYKYSDIIREYNLLYEEKEYKIIINIASFRIKSIDIYNSNLYEQIQRELVSYRSKGKDFFSERHSFFTFMEILYKKDLNTIQIKDSESPDFILTSKDKRIGIEVTEAIDEMKIELERFCQECFIQKKKTKEEKIELLKRRYPRLASKFKENPLILRNKEIKMSHEIDIQDGSVSFTDDYSIEDIFKVLEKKIIIHKNYFKTDKINLLITFNGFLLDHELEIISNKFREIETLKTSSFSNVFIINPQEKALLQFDKFGNYKKIS